MASRRSSFSSSLAVALSALLPPLVPLLFLAFVPGCGGPPPTPLCPSPNLSTPAARASLHAMPARFAVLPPSASPIDFARMAKYPEPGWHVPRSFRFSPDGKLVTFLASESQDEQMSLFAFDRTSKKIDVLVRGKDLPGGTRPRSREEELRRERERQRTEGITAYRWAKKANAMVIPNGGDVFVRDEKGAIARLTDTPEPELDPQICATGERVAFVRKGEVVAVDVATKRESVLTRGATEGVTHGLSDFVAQEELGESSGFFWSPQCDRIAYLEVDERGVGTVPVLGHRGGKADLMQQKYPETGAANPKVRIGIVDLKTKQTTWVTWPDAPGASAGGRPVERYFVDFAWSEDGKALHLQALARDHKSASFVAVAASTGAVTELFVDTNDKWVWPRATKLLPKTNEVLVTSEASGHHHLEVRKLEKGAAPRVLTKGDWEVTSIVAVDEERGRVLFMGTKDGALERHLYAVSLTEAGAPEKLTTERGTHAITADEHGRAWVDLHSSHDRLPKALVVDGKGAPNELPSHVDADLERLKLRPVEFVDVPGPSGDVLHGALLRPRVLVPGEKHPAIVMVYGGPGHQAVTDFWSARLLWQHLADRGFFVFQLDNRGTPGRGVAFERATYGRLGQVELEDQLAGVAWLTAQPGVDGARIGIHGHSYGGFMVTYAMTKSPTTFAAGLAGSPVTDWATYDTGYTERFMGTPTSNPDGYAASDVTKNAKALMGRLFIVHANMDENVHYANTAKLVDALVAANKNFDLLVFPGERHGYRGTAARTYMNQRITTFFAENL